MRMAGALWVAAGMAYLAIVLLDAFSDEGIRPFYVLLTVTWVALGIYYFRQGDPRRIARRREDPGRLDRWVKGHPLRLASVVIVSMVVFALLLAALVYFDVADWRL